MKYNCLSILPLVTAATAGMFFLPAATGQEKAPEAGATAEIQLLKVEKDRDVNKFKVTNYGKTLVLGKDGKVVEIEPGGDLTKSVQKVMLRLMRDDKTGAVKFEEIEGGQFVVPGQPGDAGFMLQLSKDKDTGELKLEKGKKGVIKVDPSGGVFKIGPAVILGEKSAKVTTGLVDVKTERDMRAELDGIKKELAEQRRLLESIHKLLRK